MKTTATLLLLVLCYTVAFSQTPTEKEMKKHQQKVAKSKEKGIVVLSLDTIFNNGSPYAILKKKKDDYSLCSLTGKELVYVQWECIDDNTNSTGKTCYYAFLFLQSSKRGEVKNYFGLSVEELIVEDDLVRDNDINPAGENKFLMKNPPKYSNKTQNPTIVVVTNGNVTSIDTYQTVERNRSASIFIMGKEIKQDFKVIGTVSESQSSMNGKAVKVISFYLPNGTKVAEAKAEGSTSHSWIVTSLKDNKQYNVDSKLGHDSEDIAKMLIEKYYL